MIDTKIGFIITYFHSSDEGLKLLIENIKILRRENYYLVLASHSPLDKNIQEMCDFYFYQQKNIVDDRKYSHGVAESNLMEISLKHLRDVNIEWTYKVTYDIEILDVNEFKKWDKREFDFISCNWGHNIICTNSFFTNVNFILNSVTFYQNIEQMFSVNNVLENCWEHDFRKGGHLDRIYSFEDKQDFYGVNRIDILYYDYNQIDFWYDDNESKFYLKNNSDVIKNSNFRIFDYYTDICIYIGSGLNMEKDIIFWILPPFSNNINKAKNGFYLEVYLENQIIRKNILIKDFNWKHPLSNKFKLIKNKDVKFNEYSDFEDLNIYSIFDIDINSINNYVDIGSNYGMSSISFIERDIKTYMVEADINNVDILNLMWDRNSKIKIINKAISSIDGEIDFYVSDDSVVSSLYGEDVSGYNLNRSKIVVESITPNKLIEKYIEEDEIDLMKIDIEGAEYDFFENISDENLKKVKRLVIEFHNNDDYRVMKIIEKLTFCDFKFKLSKWSHSCGDYIIENKMGVIFAQKNN